MQFYKSWFLRPKSAEKDIKTWFKHFRIYTYPINKYFLIEWAKVEVLRPILCRDIAFSIF